MRQFYRLASTWSLGRQTVDGSVPDPKNRAEFIDEAIVLAHSGVISLLPDHVIVHPGFVEDSTPSNKQQIAVDVQQDVNLRRGADLLLARKDVNPKRLAYGCNTKMGQAGAAVPTFLTRDLTR